jgi:DNA mismatch repair protein MSH5
MIDFSKVLMVKAASALVGFCPPQATKKIKLEEISAKDLVRMDADAFQSLQIFSTEFHPSAAGIGGGKEGFSLFSRFNRVRSAGGRKLLRQWFARPSNNTNILHDRLDHIEVLRDPRHVGAIKQIHSTLSAVKDVRRICTRITNLQSTCGDWIALRATLTAVMDLHEMTRAIASESRLRVLTAIQLSAGSAEMNRLLQLLNAVIDFEQSKAARRLTVRPGVDPTLDELKNTYAGLGDLLTRVATAQINALPEDIQIESLSTVYFPMIGYAVVIPRHPDVAVSHQIAALQEHMDYQFDTESYIYFKSPLSKGLDEELGDIHSQIVDRESQCIRELETHILQQREPMRAVTEQLAELDCLISLAISSNELRMVRPILTPESGLIRISNGRHLLQELTTATFVPNDTDMQPGKSLHLITGPNASGKSVYIKQVGLIVFLAHIGSFVPAESASIGLIDGIYTRIQTRESANIAKSSFMLDLTQIATMLRHCTPKSLLLIDEFGKGTDPADGAALLGSTLEQIQHVQAMCLATTHFTELLTPGVLQLDSAFQSLSMSFIVRPDLEQEDGLVLLFKLRLDSDRSISSMASFCARAAGVPSSVVARAAQVQEALRQGQPLTRLESQANANKIAIYKTLYRSLQSFDFVQGDAKAFVEQAVRMVAQA